MDNENEEFYEDYIEEPELEDFEDNELNLTNVFQQEEKVYFLFNDGTYKVLKCSGNQEAKQVAISLNQR